MKEVEVIKAFITGIKNSHIKVIGVYKESLNLSLIGDQKKINFNLKDNKKNNSFVLDADIKNIKNIELFQNEIEILNIKNKVSKRIILKLKSFILDLFTDVIYEANDFIGINYVGISGVKKPVLEVSGTIIKDNYEFYLLSNEKKKKLKVSATGNDFYIKQPLDKNNKKLDLIVKINDKEYYVAKIKNKTSKRVAKKIRHGNLFNYYQLYYNDNMEFACISLNGIFHPQLSISGRIDNDNSKIIIKSLNKIINYNSKPVANKNEFFHYVNLDKNQKNIEVYLDKDLILKVKNKVYYRIINKISSVSKRIYKKILHVIYVIYRGARAAWKQYHFIIPPRLWKKYWLELKNKMKSSENSLFYNPDNIKEYNKWLKIFEKEEKDIETFKYNPLISILIPVYNIGKEYLSECIESILNQNYENFEICLVDDASKKEETLETLKFYEKKDKRIKVKYRQENGHISKTTNDALKMAEGEFIGLVDNDDLLAPNALYEVVKVLNENKKIDFVYSDEDKLNKEGERCYPHFKPDFSPDTLLSLNYICHFTVIRKKLVEDVGGFEVGLEGAQDHDLFLKVTEKTKNIYHIPKILYHWRMIEGSTASNLDNKSYANDKGKIAIENALKRRKILGHVEKDTPSTYYKVVYEFKKVPMVSIIIPTRDYAETLKSCVNSIYKKTTYKNFEIIIANNGSVEKSTFALFDKYKKEHSNFKVVDVNTEFNYSFINNYAIKQAKGEYIVLLNNDTEIITPEWLNIMVGYASQKHVGAVGAKLLYPDKTVQHAGVILGLGGVASHAYIGASRNDLGAYGRLRVPYNYSAVTAACLVVSRKKYDEVNGLEETLKVAYNDVDFNIKLLEKGYYNVFCPQVELTHFESKSRGFDTTTEKYKRFLKESDYMYNKWKNLLNNDKMYNKNFSKKGWFILDKKKGK